MLNLTKRKPGAQRKEGGIERPRKEGVNRKDGKRGGGKILEKSQET